MAREWSEADLVQLVRSVMTARLQHNEVREVSVRRDVDHVGDPVLHIVVTTSGDPTCEARALVGLEQEIREAIEPDEAFPLFSIMSQADFETLDAEPV